MIFNVILILVPFKICYIFPSGFSHFLDTKEHSSPWRTVVGPHGDTALPWSVALPVLQAVVPSGQALTPRVSFEHQM